MKKLVKIAAVMLVAVMSLALLVSCGVSEQSAEKVNQAVKDKKPMTIEDCKKAFGNPTLDGTASVITEGSGVMVWINGCKDEAALKEKMSKLGEGEKVQGLVVTFAAGKATSAFYGDYDPEANK